MNKDKKDKIMVIFGSKPEENEKDNKEEKSQSRLEYTREDFGGYTPMELVNKLEESKDAIAKGSTKEAIMALDSCIVRITGKQLPENDPDSSLQTDPFYDLKQSLS